MAGKWQGKMNSVFCPWNYFLLKKKRGRYFGNCWKHAVNKLKAVSVEDFQDCLQEWENIFVGLRENILKGDKSDFWLSIYIYIWIK